MKRLNLNRLFIILTYLLACFPILPYGVRSVGTVIWAIIGVICFFLDTINRKEKINRRNTFILGITIVPFLYLALSLVYSDNILEGIKKLTQMLSLIILPLVFYLNSKTFNKAIIKKITYVFTISVIVLVFYQIIYSLINIEYIVSDLSVNEIKRNNLNHYGKIDTNIVNKIQLKRFRNFVTEKVDTHTTFQGLWVVFALLIIIRKYIESKSKIFVKVNLTLLFLILFSWLLILSTRVPLFSFFIALIGALIVTRSYPLKFYIFTTISFLLIGISSYNTIPSIKIRIDEVLTTKFELPSNGNNIETYNSTNVRNGVYFCSLDLIYNNFIFGVGIGDMQDKLNSCYNSKIGAKIYTWKNYNSHNQFLFFLISTGIIGFILFSISILYQFKIAIKYSSFEYFYFLILVVLISLSENILSRSDGVLFFSFFNSLFLFNINNKYDNN